jgi:hypothetical protein
MIRFNHLTQTYEGDNGYKVTAEKKELWAEKYTAWLTQYSVWYYKTFKEKNNGT